MAVRNRRPNLLSPKKITRLNKSIDWSNRQLDFARRKRVESIHLYVGSHYAEGTSTKRVPVNHLKMAVEIYSRALAPHSPRSLIRALNESMISTALDMEYAVNQIPPEIGLNITLRRWVVEALFSIGILKCGLKDVGAIGGIPYGQTFVDNLTIDDYFVDMAAQHLDSIQYEGNTYWKDYEDVMEADWVKKSARSFLKPDEERAYNEHGQQRAEDIMRKETATTFRDRILLRDIWLPKESRLVTVAVTSEKFLNETELETPEAGPYIKLGFTEVPGNLLPFAPVQTWRDLHELGNSIFRKLGRQADGEKSVLGFSGSNDDDVKDFQGARDGDGITYHGQKPEKLTAGGINEKTLAFYLQCRDLQSYFAGNLDSLGGLAQLTETVGQDKLLSDAASAQLREMSATTVEAIKKIYRIIAFNEWNDPIRQRTIEKQIPGTDISIPVNFGPENKIGDFEDLEIDIDVYSLQDNSPTERLSKLNTIMMELVVPLSPQIEAMGGTIDVKLFLDYVARYSDMPELREIVKFIEGYRLRQDQPTQAATTPLPGQQRPREYIHRSPGPGREGLANQMVQNLVGGREGEGAGG
jgi:hypothetical protein